MSFQTVLTVLGALLGLAGLLGILYAAARSGLEKRTAELWKGEAEALEAKVERLSANELDCKQRLAAAEGAIETLKGWATGEVRVGVLADRIEDLHQQLIEEVRKHGQRS